jgi:hypothetical protein
MSPEDIDNRFRFHPASPEKAKKHEFVRDLCKMTAHDLNDRLPEGREKSLAITHLEEVMYWANAAIARQQDSGLPPGATEEQHL